METLKQRTISTDVLVIGAGGAGIRAAIEAHNLGAKVLVVSKGDYPAGCITAIAMGAISAAIDQKDSRDSHYEDTLKGGHYLSNPKLVRLLADLGPERALEVERYGTEFDKVEGRYDLFSYPGNAVPRAILAGDRYNGGFFKGLVREAARLGIEVLDHVMVIDLLRREGAVCGAAALEIDRETLLIVQAKSVVIATGGAGNLFSLTTNLSGITGDGCALAYEAGAQLSDMEFVQSRACMIHPEAMRGTPPPGDGGVTIGGRFYNGLCERYMKKYHPDKAEQVTRAEVARCTQKEILEGRASPHGGVYGDFSGVPQREAYEIQGLHAGLRRLEFRSHVAALRMGAGRPLFHGRHCHQRALRNRGRGTVCRGRGAVGHDGRQPPARKRPHGNAGFRRDRGGAGVETGPLARTARPFTRNRRQGRAGHRRPLEPGQWDRLPRGQERKSPN